MGLRERVIAHVKPLRVSNWLGAIGDRYRKGLKWVADQCEEHEVSERGKDLARFGWTAIEGKARKPLADAVVAEQEAANRSLDARLKAETLEHKAREAAARADEAETDADLKKMALLKELRDAGCGLQLEFSEDGQRIRIVKKGGPELLLEGEE